MCAIATLCTGATDPPIENAAAYVSLKFEGTCDSDNKRLYLANRHTYKSIETTIRWIAVGGKALMETFSPEPTSEMEIGCAANATIIEAAFAEF
jgi:hypothetical protein